MRAQLNHFDRNWAFAYAKYNIDGLGFQSVFGFERQSAKMRYLWLFYMLQSDVLRVRLLERLVCYVYLILV